MSLKKLIDLDMLARFKSKVTALIPATYAASQSAGGPADKAVAIPFGHVDSASTNKAFTATVDGITELRDGVCVYLQNGVVTSASGFTLNINGLGAKHVYQTMAAASAVTTLFNVNYTMLFVYNETRVSGGCWDMFYGYNANTTYSNASLGQGYATAAGSGTTLTAALSSYAATVGGYVAIKFPDNVAAGTTLNINGKGAKALYYRGAAITDGIIKAGDVAVFVFSTQYHLVSIDRWGLDIATLDARLDALVDGDEVSY